jgi:hypothetical protein
MDEYVRRVFEGEAPCDKCSKAQDCREYEWACRAFSYYVLNGTFKEYTVRQPTKHMFNKIFKEDDKALKNYMKSIRAKEQMGIVDLFEKEEINEHQD